MPSFSYLVRPKEQVSWTISTGNFQLLRVLHLHEIGVKGGPNEICTLIHLRYLQVAVDVKKCKSLLAWIANLCNLQTLHIATIKVRNLQTRHLATIKPRKLQILRVTTTKVDEEILLDIDCNILKMQNLRHVHVELGRFTGWPILSFPSNLQTLKYIEAGHWMGDDCLGKLINLRKLGIVEVDMRRHGDILFYSIPKLKHLQSLTLHVSPGGSLYPFLPILNLLHLYKLYLGGGLEKLPESHEFSPNLTKLTLQDTTLGQDPMPTLEKLQNLRILRLLHSAYMGKEMVCSVQGFPRLESLKLKKLDYLEKWRVEEGAMPSLLHLHMYQCRQLKTLPEGLQHVTSLRKLELIMMPWSSTKRVQEERRDDWQKIQHIPSIDIR
ncbi:probable disease resistance RPP8-like protein 4 isoform X1 [Magnolia sinica]|uniref:probable disease resistance RPP8-like protein 4 isoform X1 n=1 Tax=Magnolia sinica TaxID=86752 RepID=UPI00265B56A8|nr:probable disease resistance RPP8-like protein 4 isoform X1 [Magnolia sinica]XP_058115403.1 probable disease resistance RPP8-like protein 4 isoform X1 [Magnolia sinica]XP_058115404.1 probable disease resistance RPP8-like protein 4 isoform X1 [Magnolia sinica]XP_058115405.1 probable disease resistance RPP8-like protein 4 isoform X1 [Magnolia sinica]XP_058115406.1 probable disease resistance RPP8-like protein 4 isoform X1 [Magnolia sinica]XP_058115407.1 probable disease resistance RPP8-like pr